MNKEIPLAEIKSNANERLEESFETNKSIQKVENEMPKRSTKTNDSTLNQNISLTSTLDRKSLPGEFDHFKPQFGEFFSDINEIRKNCRLFPCETIIKSEKVSYNTYHLNWIGILVITDYRMIFCFKDEKKLFKQKYHPNYFHVPFYQIEKVTQLQDKEKTASCPLEITLKDFRVINFYLWEKDSSIIDLLKKSCFPKDPKMLFGFTSTYNEYTIKTASEQNKESTFENGWNLFNPIEEFERQKVFQSKGNSFRYCKANEDFKLFPTYPELFIVLNDMDDKQLVEASKHRTKNRLPALSFFYGKNKKNEETKAAIWRSSQTKSGIMGSKNSMDVILLNKISKLCDKLVIFDARPYLNAVANKANGGGFENVGHYENTELVFCDIDNIHAVRNSLNKLQQLCSSPKM